MPWAGFELGSLGPQSVVLCNLNQKNHITLPFTVLINSMCFLNINCTHNFLWLQTYYLICYLFSNSIISLQTMAGGGGRDGEIIIVALIKTLSQNELKSGCSSKVKRKVPSKIDFLFLILTCAHLCCIHRNGTKIVTNANSSRGLTTDI